MAVQDLELIEKKIDRVAAGAIEISDNVGGISFTSMGELLEFAKLLSVAGTAIPKHLRGNPGACLAVTIQALEWRMSPVAVANKSYEVNDRIAYESQLIHAVVEARAPLKQRLRATYDGEGDTLTCTVTGHFKGEVDPLEYTSPAFGKITVKNSPLWKSDPRQQLWYYSVRAWARRFCPDVLLGIYSEDELDREAPGENATDVTPANQNTDLASRIKKKSTKGFHPDNMKAIDHKPGETLPETGPKPEPLPVERSEIDAEIDQKRAALSQCTDPDEVQAITEGVTDLLRERNREDLLPGFLEAVSKEANRIASLPGGGT